MTPVYPKYFADPFVWRHDRSWYAVGTADLGADGVFPILHSADFVTWKFVRPAMAHLPSEFGDTYWAPEVAFNNGTFYLYYSIGRGDKSHHVRVATSRTPDGPYEDVGARVTSPFEIPFAIDASPFRDRDGDWYLSYARDFLDESNGYRAGTGIVIDRLLDMTRLAGEPRVITRAKYDWQRFLKDRIMYGGYYDWHTVEGPFLWLHGEKYYCFYSAGRWENESYGVDYATADHPMGPWKDHSGPTGAKVLRSGGELIGPGHNSVTVGQNGSDYIVFHAWDATATNRLMFIEPMKNFLKW